MHDFLEMWWQLDQRSSNLSLVSTNLKWHISGCSWIILVDLRELVRIILLRDMHRVNQSLLSHLAVVILGNCFLNDLFPLTDLFVKVLCRHVAALVCLCWAWSCIVTIPLLQFRILRRRCYVFQVTWFVRFELVRHSSLGFPLGLIEGCHFICFLWRHLMNRVGLLNLLTLTTMALVELIFGCSFWWLIYSNWPFWLSRAWTTNIIVSTDRHVRACAISTHAGFFGTFMVW